jgi:head-tail adaptor
VTVAFDRLLRHTVTISRAALGSLDEYGQPSRTYADVATVPALVQPKPSRSVGGGAEESTTYFAGTQITDHTVFLRPTDVTAADRIVHGDDTFEVLLVKDAGGQDHHLELDVRLIEPAEVA